MNVTVWLLLSIGLYAHTGTRVVERFSSEQECRKVVAAVKTTGRYPEELVCIQATVVK